MQEPSPQPNAPRLSAAAPMPSTWPHLGACFRTRLALSTCWGFVPGHQSQSACTLMLAKHQRHPFPQLYGHAVSMPGSCLEPLPTAWGVSAGHNTLTPHSPSQIKILIILITYHIIYLYVTFTLDITKAPYILHPQPQAIFDYIILLSCVDPCFIVTHPPTDVLNSYYPISLTLTKLYI